MISKIRTDLACEAHALWRESAGETSRLPGVRARSDCRDGFEVERVEILDAEGARALGKAEGRYITVDVSPLLHREENAFGRACELLSQELRSLLQFPVTSSYLVVGLGNRAITPDAIGPVCLEHLLVTRHLKQHLPEYFAAFRTVTAVSTGVLGTTGVESSEFVAALCRELSPCCVIAIDALAARDPQRLCRNIQLSDTGIVPGSGVGNARGALNQETLGVPVIALGVPTVVDAATLCCDSGGRCPDEAAAMFVTPRDIDKQVKDMAKLLGYSLNFAFHDGLTMADIDMFLT